MKWLPFKYGSILPVEKLHGSYGQGFFSFDFRRGTQAVETPQVLYRSTA